MENDDILLGRILTRREVLALFGAASAAMLAACAPGQSNSTQPTSAAAPATNAPTSAPTSAPTQAAAVATQAPSATNTAAAAAANATSLPSCIVRPALTEGPYFVDEMLNRSDIRSDPSDGSVKDGAPLNLVIRVSQIDGSGCTPLAGAQIDLWHCDASGIYSDASDPSFNTKGKKFLRGYQMTDANGTAQFTTIYPGWYHGRAVHIHFKIRTLSSDKTYDFTSQFFFDDAFSKQVYAAPPYAAKGTQGMLANGRDGIYQQSGGQTVLNVAKDGQGYASTFDIGLQMN